MLEVVKFLLFLLIFVFLPGRFLIYFLSIKISKIETFLLSGALGVILVAVFSFVFGYLGSVNFVFIFLLLADIYLLFIKKWRPSFPQISKKHILPIVIVCLGAGFQSILLVKSGTSYQGGLAFWGVHGYDALWHSALIQELTYHFPPQNPGFAGESLRNYHFLTDLFIAGIHKVSGISILDLYFRFVPVFFTLLLNALIYVFLKNWAGKSVAFWGIFFASIAGSFGWALPLIGKGSNNWETAFWSIQPTSSFLNPPFGVSLILLMTGLILLQSYFKQSSYRLALVLGLVFGSLIGFKAYGGLIILATLGVFAGVGLLRKETKFLFILVPSVLVSLILYLPVNSGSTNYFVWQPWWFIQTMIEAPDRANWSSLELRRQVYALDNNWRSIIILQSFAFFIFVVGNLGARVLGFISVGKKIFQGDLDRFLLLIMLIAFAPPIFFIQKVVPWNSIQFFYYFVFIFSFFAAASTALIISKLRLKFLKILFAVIVIGASLPSTVKTIYWFTAPVPTTLLYKEEIEALDFLKNNSKVEDVLLTYPFGDLQPKYFPNPPVPMTYYNSPYVSFFTGRRVYLEDQNAANLLSYDAEGRLNKEKAFFQTDNITQARNFLLDADIKYIYLVDRQSFSFPAENAGLIEIFNNQKVRIYKALGDKI